MRTETLFDDGHMRVKAVYYHGKLLYIRTYVLDSEGYVDKDVTVSVDGRISTQ